MNIQDIEFNDHPVCMDGKHGKAKFDNGYQASIVSGSYFYTSSDAPYEIAVMYKGSIVYDTYITDDVLGYLSEDEANEILSKIEALPAREE